MVRFYRSLRAGVRAGVDRGYDLCLGSLDPLWKTLLGAIDVRTRYCTVVALRSRGVKVGGLCVHTGSGRRTTAQG